jgi:hypothetical protein
MRTRRTVLCALPLLTVLASACATFRQSGSRADDAPSGVTQEKGAIVLTGAALTDGAGFVLGALTGKVPNMRVRTYTGECPQITLRSHVSFEGIVNPHVYVDGTRATDTCILETIRTNDVERVEVYPQGFTTRPGYGTHAHGLILVFLRSG